MKRLLLSLALVVAVVAMTSTPAEACKRRVRLIGIRPLIPAPVLVSPGCGGPVVPFPVVVAPPPVVVAEESCGPAVVVTRPLRPRVQVSLEAAPVCGGGGVQISTPVGVFRFGR